MVPNRLASPGSAPGPGAHDTGRIPGGLGAGQRCDRRRGIYPTWNAGGCPRQRPLPNSEDSVTRTVLQNVVVLSAGQVLQPEPKGQVINAQVVTLQVRPEEAEILALTSGEGRIQLVLRNFSDNAVAPTPGAHLTAIYNVGGKRRQSQSRSARRKPAFRKAASPAPAAPVLPIAPPPPAPQHRRADGRGDSRHDAVGRDADSQCDQANERPPKKSDKKIETENRKVTRRLYAPYHVCLKPPCSSSLLAVFPQFQSAAAETPQSLELTSDRDESSISPRK